MKIVFFGLFFCCITLLNGQIVFETIPITRPDKTLGVIDMVKLAVTKNENAFNGFDKIFIRHRKTIVDSILISDLKISDLCCSAVLDSIFEENKIHLFQNNKLKYTYEFDDSKRLISVLEFGKDGILTSEKKFEYDTNGNVLVEKEFEFWSSAPNANLVLENRYIYNEGELTEKISKKVLPINRSYTISHKIYNCTGSLLSEKIDFYYRDGEIYQTSEFRFKFENNFLIEVTRILKKESQIKFEYSDHKVFVIQ